MGAPITLFLLIQLSNILKSEEIYKKTMAVFMACACSLTSMAHIINITVTRRLISEGVNVPNYFRIGYWPSVEMAVDYLAWGFFVGLAFLCIGFSATNNDKSKISIKRTTIISGLLCLIGFFGALFINENLWYLAPLGYGIIPVYICIKMLKLKNNLN